MRERGLWQELFIREEMALYSGRRGKVLCVAPWQVGLETLEFRADSSPTGLAQSAAHALEPIAWQVGVI